jgi:hypothetical protein
VFCETLEDVWKVVELYEKEVLKLGKEFDLIQALAIARANPEWFVDARTIELIETYLFYQPNSYAAYPGSFSDQPSIWIQAKIILDGILKWPTSLL